MTSGRSAYLDAAFKAFAEIYGEELELVVLKLFQR